jgi:hypothetical protein
VNANARESDDAHHRCCLAIESASAIAIAIASWNDTAMVMAIGFAKASHHWLGPTDGADTEAVADEKKHSTDYLRPILDGAAIDSTWHRVGCRNASACCYCCCCSWNCSCARDLDWNRAHEVESMKAREVESMKAREVESMKAHEVGLVGARYFDSRLRSPRDCNAEAVSVQQYGLLV